MQLVDNDAFAAVDNEGGILCHQRHFAEIDIGLADINDMRFVVFGVLFTDDEPETRGEGDLIVHPAGETFVKRPFRFTEPILHEFEARHLVEIGDRKNFLEDSLQAAIGAALRMRIALQEVCVGTLLCLNQIR